LIGTLVGIATHRFVPNPYHIFFRTTFFSAVFAVTNSLRLQGIRGRSSHGITGLRLII
jgi:hypothetical protein